MDSYSEIHKRINDACLALSYQTEDVLVTCPMSGEEWKTYAIVHSTHAVVDRALVIRETEKAYLVRRIGTALTDVVWIAKANVYSKTDTDGTSCVELRNIGWVDLYVTDHPFLQEAKFAVYVGPAGKVVCDSIHDPERGPALSIDDSLTIIREAQKNG